MIKYLTMITSVSSVLLVKAGTTEHMAKKDELWHYMKQKNYPLYKAVKKTAMGAAMQMDSVIGKKAIVTGYAVANKIFAFN